MQNLLEELTSLLKKDERFVSEGRLLKNSVIEAALQLDTDLLKLLLSHKSLKKHFFKKIDDFLVFDKIEFQKFVSNKSFLKDSYTAFSNKIGLTSDDEFISESKNVVLSWPHKDCILEGGQTKEDEKRDEIFWNETLAPDEIDRLLSPKVLTNFKKYDSKGEHKVTDISLEDNLIIKGNNLLALYSLLPIYRGRVKLICIDPPYNRGDDDFNYNDNFNHSTWLTFMSTRLNAAFELLHNNGTIFVFCDDNEHAYLKVLMDNLFGRDRFITSIVWRNSDNSNNDAKRFSTDHNYILVYSRNNNWNSYKVERTEDQAKHYKNPDNNPRGPWFDGNPVNSPNPRKNLKYKVKGPKGNWIDPPPNGWRWDPTTMQKKISSGEIRFNEEGNWIIRRSYLNEQKDLPPSTLWNVCEEPFWMDLNDTGHTRQAKYEQKSIFPGIPTSNLFKTPKPERVIKKIIQISTHEGDYVLDFFAGSGTTAAVAHKMNRKYIICEQMESIDTFVLQRIKKVIAGDEIGISKLINWKGGGSCVYLALSELNQSFFALIKAAKTIKELKNIWTSIKKDGFISYKVNPSEIDKNISEFDELSIADQKKFLIEVLDKNHLYINYSEIEDKDYNITADDKKLNKKFYSLK